MQNKYATMAAALRVLSADMVEAAGSGHPGLPLGMADVLTVLWGSYLNIHPQHANWHNRDRFVLSAGHGSAALYALLYLVGMQGVELSHLKTFRKLHSPAAGHPEYGAMPGIETTTGPLGQGLANAVGMALAERKLAEEFGTELVNHYTYCVVGDGCLMEGISQEAISLAGHLNLNKLIVLWDNNHITIDGPTDLSTSEDIPMRFQACGWDVLEIDGHNYLEIHTALNQAKQNIKPTLIACKTIIGKGAPNKQGTSGIHGSPLGADELQALRKKLKCALPPFELSEKALEYWRNSLSRVDAVYEAWQNNYVTSNQKQAFDRWHSTAISAEVTGALSQLKAKFIAEKTQKATRNISQSCLEVVAPHLPNLVGGSADLTPSNNTQVTGMQAITAHSMQGNYVHYGIREHAMAAVMNGLSLHGGIRPYGGTFLCFSDYAKPAMRLSALMHQPIVYVMTHDSIGLGEDGPTHQPIEHLAALRAVPNLQVFRPADAIETAECWELALQSEKTPSVLVLTRQALPLLRNDAVKNESAKGAYILKHVETPDITLVATGSEVSLAVETAHVIETSTDRSVSVVSMPCWELFEQQELAYQQQILGRGLAIGIEAASTFGWHKWVTHIIGLDTFGVSAPAQDAYTHFGLTSHNIAEKCISLLKMHAAR